MKIVKSFKVARCWQYGLFLDVRNLFNVKNVVDVYPYSGKPDDSGYPPQREGFAADESWLKAYEDWRKYCQDPANYGIPRIVRIGIWVKL